MAELPRVSTNGGGALGSVRSAQPAPRALVDGIRGYRMIAAMWIRAAVSYRTSFVLLASAQFVVTGLDFIMIVILFTHTRELGGFTSAEVFFLYAGSGLALAFADLLAGSLELVGRRIRDGSLDSLLVRPIPVVAQLAADQFAVRRVGRILQAGTVFIVALVTGDIVWSPAKVLLTLVMVVSGTALFIGIFMLGACFQFVAGDAAEVSNAFTYGGDALSQLPWTIYPRELVRTVVLVLPLAFVSWVPAAWILDRPLPLGMPSFMAWTSPVAAAALLTVAGLLWRVALRSYRSTGS
ncbi:MAG TPA: ABC-2 family transporter protein [Actinopolymorphaceae bacterium]